MKIRNGFVSNSSSSSFIIKETNKEVFDVEKLVNDIYKSSEYDTEIEDVTYYCDKLNHYKDMQKKHPDTDYTEEIECYKDIIDKFKNGNCFLFNTDRGHFYILEAIFKNLEKYNLLEIIQADCE